MTKDEQYQFCLDITVAARRMGFAMRDDSISGLYQFSWIDIIGGPIVTGDKFPDRQDAYQSVCEKLVDHIAIIHPYHHENAPRQNPVPNQTPAGEAGVHVPAEGHQPAPVPGSEGGVGGSQV